MTKREDILAAALKLLTSKGVHATPMSNIAREAGTGMGTIYNYFPNKIALINALYIKIKNSEKSIFAAFEQDKSLRTQFEDYYAKAIQFYIDNPQFFHFMEQLQASPIITKESKETGYEAITFVIELIENGKTNRLIKNIDTNELMQFIGGTIISYLRLHFQSASKEKPSLANQLKMVWDAIKE